jgi:acetolactate synthase-1/2/3 large subunit
MPSVAQAIASTLHAAGVRYVFGLPGGETVELLDALRLQGLEFVLVHNESSALFMADAYARLTGTAGVCLTTLGPGASNAVVGVAHAYLDRAPLLIFTAQKPDALLPDYTHQVLDLHALFAPITKASIKLDASCAARGVAQALRLAQEGRPGPVHLQISNEDAALATTDSHAPLFLPEPPAAPGSKALARARDLLAAARRPLLVAGLGLEPQRPYVLLRELAETLNAPVVVTPKAKGALPDDHPLAAGTVGLTRTDPVYALLDEADCILALGFDVVELVKPWQSRAPVIWLAPWPNHDPVIPAAVELVGDLHAMLDQLADIVPATDPSWGRDRVAAYHASLVAPLPQPAPGRLLPQTVLDTLRRHLPPGALLSVDVGSHKILGSLDWPALAPNRFLLSNGLSSMGYGLPAALGAALALPRQTTVCITGDAGFAMVMGELGVAARLNLPVLILVFNDGAIDLIRAQQVRAGKPVYGTEFDAPRFDRIAAAYGIAAQRIGDQAALDQAIAQALAAQRPTVLEIMLDPSSYPTTPRGISAPA